MMEENFAVAQKERKRVARGAHEVSPKKTWRDKSRQEVHTGNCLRKRGGTKSKRRRRKKKWQEVKQVMKKTLGWHRREEKERQEVHTRNCLRKLRGANDNRKIDHFDCLSRTTGFSKITC